MYPETIVSMLFKMNILTTSNRHLHLLFSFLIALVSWEAAIGAGITKEYADYKWGGKFDLMDLLFDAIGIGLGVLAKYAIITFIL